MGGGQHRETIDMFPSGFQSPTLEHYSGYEAQELPPLVKRLNFLLTYRHDERLKAVRSKYSHR